MASPDYLIQTLTAYKFKSSYFNDLSSAYTNGSSPPSFMAYNANIDNSSLISASENMTYSKSNLASGAMSQVANDVAGVNREFVMRQFDKAAYVDLASNEHATESSYMQTTGIRQASMMSGSSSLQQN